MFSLSVLKILLFIAIIMTKDKKYYVKTYKIIIDLWNNSKLFFILLGEWLDYWFRFFTLDLTVTFLRQNGKLRSEYDGHIFVLSSLTIFLYHI